MAYDGLQQLVPQKRSLYQDEQSTYFEAKARCISCQAPDFSHSESLFHYQAKVVPDNDPGELEAPRCYPTGIGPIANTSEAEDITKDENVVGYQNYPDLCGSESFEVCYGCIRDVSAEFRGSLPMRSDSVFSNNDMCILEVLPGPDYFVICAPSTDEMIGFIDLKTSSTLKSLQHAGDVRLEIALKFSEWGIMQHNFRTRSTMIVEITVFGMLSIADAVGSSLSGGGLFLQSPLYDTGAQHHNPHLLSFSDVSESETDNENCWTENTPIENTPKSAVSPPTDALFDVMNDLDQHEELCPVQVDSRLTVELLRHQRAGVDFMLHRETGLFRTTKSLWLAEPSSLATPCYRHAITGSKTFDPLAGPFGGILADEMGLGKTLTTLATILSTLNDAELWLLSKPSGTSTRRRSKATVIIVPSEVLMNQWLEEIRTRIIPGTVVAYKYHGQSRGSQTENLQRTDIMLTTYATAMSELRSGKGLLHKIDFYRLVLDEAHDIRTRGTRKHAAVSKISATRRWCLTGTPIQNKVDDLGALVSFLQVPILDDPEVFRVHITNQTYSNVSNRFDNLRSLLRCICLRRTKAIGYLDDPTVDLLYLELSNTEAQNYNEIVRRHRAKLEMAISLKNSSNASHQILNAIHELRLFCNNGSSEANERPCITSTSMAIDRNVKIWQKEDEVERGICRAETPDLCGTTRQIHFRLAKDSPETLPAPTTISSSDVNLEAIHRASLSSKLRALVKRIAEQPLGEKCIVFSFWQRTLDLVGAILQHHSIDCLRIDGSVSNTERQRALRGFDKAPERMVLLMTIGTGAVGLNLTSATRVHILEPQWNPMVEQQAIGRALRLGQTKKVIVSRYIMKGTIEEHVVSSQAYKLQVALKSFEKHGHDDCTEEKAKIFNEIIPEITNNR